MSSTHTYIWEYLFYVQYSKHVAAGFYLAASFSFYLAAGFYLAASLMRA